jgi:predicted RNA-binding protein with PIN domain
MSSKLEPLMLVDAYNVIGKWRDLSQIVGSYSFAAARDELILKMTNYCGIEQLDTILVFDAYHQNHCGNEEEISKFLRVYFTEQGQTADAFIEKRCSELRHQRRLIVVTSDRVEGWTVKGYGAELRSAESLVVAVEAGIRLMRQRQQQQTKKAVSLEHRSKIKPSDRAKLEKMRFGL